MKCSMTGSDAIRRNVSRMVVSSLKPRLWITRLWILTVLVLTSSSLVWAQDDRTVQQQQQFLNFIRQQARTLRAGDQPPESVDQWAAEAAKLKAHLRQAWGTFPDPCPLEPKKLGELNRDGYRVERIVFQTMPGVLMAANAYVPDPAKAPRCEADEKAGGRRAAVLCVHGHWAGAKQDPVVQSRCIGLAKLGFFVLCVDAFGAGERGIGRKLGEYHGEMTGAMLYPIGRPLSGIQVYENMRAVDYLQSRPEVDPLRIGITGASGGGNQTMYAGAFDERFRCVVPTCSVGNYQAYLGAACCMCEVVPAALRFTEEGNILGLASQRGLMVTSATRDAFQFSVDQAVISVTRAQAIARVIGGPDASTAVKHTVIESPHHYNQPMREAMYGWMTKHLKGVGDGSPIAEPMIQTEDPEALRCYPGESRPEDYVTIPVFAARAARSLLAGRAADVDTKRLAALDVSTTLNERSKERAPFVAALLKAVGGFPENSPLNTRSSFNAEAKREELVFESEPGITMVAVTDPMPKGKEANRKLAILIDVNQGCEKAFSSKGAKELRDTGWTIVAPELRATGRYALPSDKIGHAPDHNTAEWSLWIGRPLLGQWAWDLRRTLDAIAERDGSLPEKLSIVGVGPSGVIALTAAALDDRIEHAMAIDSLASFVSDEPYRGQRLGLMIPGLFRDVGDVAHIAALIAPRRVTIAGGVTGGGKNLSVEQLQKHYEFTRDIYAKHHREGSLSIVPSEALAETLTNEKGSEK